MKEIALGTRVLDMAYYTLVMLGRQVPTLDPSHGRRFMKPVRCKGSVIRSGAV